MGLNEVFAKARGLDADPKALLIATLPLRGGYSGANGTEGIDLSATDYEPTTSADGRITRVFCAGSAGNVKFQMADGNIDVLPIAAADWLSPAPMFITKIFKTGTTATLLHVYW